MRKIKFHFPLFFLSFLIAIIGCRKENRTLPEPHNPYMEWIQKGEYMENNFHYDSAYSCYNEAKAYVFPNTEQATYIALKTATLQQYIGDYYGCEETITEAIHLNEQSIYLPYLYNLIAICYHKQNNIDDALLHYNKALNQIKEPLDKIIYQNNIGLLYLEKKEYERAIENYKILLKNSILEQNPLEWARVMDNYGYTLFKSKSPDALSYLKKSFHIRDSMQDNNGLIASNIHLSEYYQTSNTKLAKEFAQKGLLTATRLKSPDDQLEALNWLTQLSSPQEAKKYFEQYIKITDSLTKARSKAKNQFAKVKYDAKKATQEVIKYKNQKSILIIILGLIIIIVFLLYRLYQNKHKRKLQLATYITETRISKRIHDELANDVFNAMTYTQTQNLENPISKEALLDNLEHIYQRTRDISKENSDIRTDENYEPDLFRMIDSYSDHNLNVIRKINEPINWQKITPEKKITLQRVLQEFLINTKKHSEATVVIIDFSVDKKNILVTYTDNGIGIKNTQQRKSGLQNAENRILAIQGSFTFDQTLQKGFKVTLVIPK